MLGSDTNPEPCCCFRREMGVEALMSFHMHMRMNGKYYGKYAYVEQLDEDSIQARFACRGAWAVAHGIGSQAGTLGASSQGCQGHAPACSLTLAACLSLPLSLLLPPQNWGYPDASASPGPLWKSTSGEFSNLRWDIPRDQIQFYWKKFTRKGSQYESADQQGLLDFAVGLAGGGSMPRSAYLFQAVDLPQVGVCAQPKSVQDTLLFSCLVGVLRTVVCGLCMGLPRQ